MIRLRRWFDRFQWKSKVRKLEVSRGGYWYLISTVGLGVFALAIGNNVVYLIESFLLAGLILSGVLSEKVISSVKVDFARDQARAGSRLEDWVILENTTNSSRYCIEIGEWKEGKFYSIAYVPFLKAHSQVRVKVEQTLTNRGVYQWDGFAIATSFPFGFARKMKIVRKSGERIVWPEEQIERDGHHEELLSHRGNRLSLLERVDGEIRPYVDGEDARHILANQSLRGVGAMVRNQKPSLMEPEVVLDLRKVEPVALEDEIIRAAARFYQQEQGDLILFTEKGKRTYSGRRQALNTLAMIPRSDSAGFIAYKRGEV